MLYGKKVAVVALSRASNVVCTSVMGSQDMSVSNQMVVYTCLAIIIRCSGEVIVSADAENKLDTKGCILAKDDQSPRGYLR